MIILQLIEATVLFLYLVVSGNFALESLVALYIIFLILVSAGMFFSSPKLLLFLVILKVSLCLLLKPFSPLPVLLLPTLGLEIPTCLARDRVAPLGWLITSLVLLSPVVLLPEELVLIFLGFWSVSVFVALSRHYFWYSSKRLSARLKVLEKELTEAEAKTLFLKRIREEEELLVKYEERDSIAVKLHDSLGHTITGSIMQLEAAKLFLPENPKKVQQILDRVSSVLKEGLDEIRLTLKAIKPEPALLGLQRIIGILDNFAETYGRSVRLEKEGDMNIIPSFLWQIVESNLQEALTNLLKHSSGRTFLCSIRVLNQFYKVEFRDDGTVAPVKGRGLGLEGMEMRTREAGGNLLIDTTKGFSIIMLFKKEGIRNGNLYTDRG